MNESQRNFLKLLGEIDTVCRKHSITYYLAGGTALGAVRNSGFLPWDDDVDLYITRANFVKLQEVIDDEIRPDRAFVSQYRSPDYNNPIARYVDKTTTTIMLSQALAGVECGQHLEFLVMDPVPRDVEKMTEFKNLLLVYTELLTPYFVVNRQVVNRDSYFDPDLYREYEAQVEQVGRQEVLDELERAIFQYPDDESCEFYCLRWGLKIHMYRREYFGIPRYVKFEGLDLPVAQRAESVFRQAYGDTWMMVPKAKDREQHDALRSQTLSYVNYSDDYMAMIDQREALSDYAAFKREKMRLLFDTEKKAVLDTRMAAAMCSAQVEQRLGDPSVNLGRLMAERKFSEIAVLLEGYYERQLSSDFVKWQVLVGVPDQVKYAAVYSLLMLSRYDRALTLLSIYAANGVRNADLDRLADVCKKVRSLSIAIYDDRAFEDARHIIDRWDLGFRDIPEFRRYDVMTRAELCTDDLALASIQSEMVSLLSEFPRDWELWKALGDIALRLGDRDTAWDCYKRVYSSSRNGILLRDIARTQVQWGLAPDVAPAMKGR